MDGLGPWSTQFPRRCNKADPKRPTCVLGVWRMLMTGYRVAGSNMIHVGHAYVDARVQTWARPANNADRYAGEYAWGIVLTFLNLVGPNQGVLSEVCPLWPNPSEMATCGMDSR
jgi:hypothetical protein